jgi:hypothetical protein
VSSLRGAIICESLEPGTVLEGFDMKVVSWRRYEVRDVPDYQPSLWTLIEFDAPVERSDALAEKLSNVLMGPGWYANWNTEDEAVVVFRGKVFRYARGDAAGRAAAQQHGRKAGVPEPQLDWGE